MKNQYELTLNDQLIEDIQATESEINKLIINKTNGAVIRSRARYIEHGEKNTKYFFNLERRNYNMKVLAKLRLDNNEIITDPALILEEEKNFYKKLYMSNLENTNVEQFLNNMPTLTQENSLKCEEDLSEAEIYQTILSFNDNKSPGTDGLPSEFYKTMWPFIKTLLCDCYKYIETVGKMSITQRQGIIILIPKKDKDRELLKNWRPLSLLNTDYKILAKCIANRIKKVLPEIIHCDQTGFLPNRYIGENINRIFGIMHYSKVYNINPCLVAVDFEKAFDFLERSFVIHSLKYFKFGPKILNWVNILYKDIDSCVTNNGWTSQFFPVTRGVRQGCPLSPYLFILAVESLANKIRNNNNIKGVNIDGVKHVISLYADDTTLFLLGDAVSFNECLSVFQQFKTVSGLKMNMEKTEVMPLNGSCNHRKKVENLGLKWNPGPLNILGILITRNLEEMIRINYDIKIANMKTIIKTWSFRNLTIMGKITIIKSLIISQLMYLLQCLPTPNQSYLRSIEKLLFSYLWNNGPDKIKRSVIIAPKCKGGLDMVHIPSLALAVKISWIKRLLTGDLKKGWRQIVHYEFNKLTPIIFECNLHTKDIKLMKMDISTFWKEILHYWCQVNYETPLYGSDFINLPIWYNTDLRIENKIFMWRKFYNCGIRYIKDLINITVSPIRVYSAAELQNIYHCNINFIQVASIHSSLSKYKHEILQTPVHNITSVGKKSEVDMICNRKNCSKYVYNKVLLKVYSKPQKIIDKWCNDLEMSENEIFEAFSYIYKLTIDVKMRTFQYRLLHRYIALNNFLFRIKISETDKCMFCNLEKETLSHLFYYCVEVRNLWLHLKTWLNTKDIYFPFVNEKLIMLGKSDVLYIDKIILITNRYFYKTKCSGSTLSVIELKNYIKMIHETEKLIAASNGKLQLHKVIWQDMLCIFDD